MDLSVTTFLYVWSRTEYLCKYKLNFEKVIIVNITIIKTVCSKQIYNIFNSIYYYLTDCYEKVLVTYKVVQNYSDLLHFILSLLFKFYRHWILYFTIATLDGFYLLLLQHGCCSVKLAYWFNWFTLNCRSYCELLHIILQFGLHDESTTVGGRCGTDSYGRMMFLVDKKHATVIVFTHTRPHTSLERSFYILRGFAFAKRAVDVPGGEKKRNGCPRAVTDQT